MIMLQEQFIKFCFNGTRLFHWARSYQKCNTLKPRLSGLKSAGTVPDKVDIRFFKLYASGNVEI